uniref:Ig-like domain-containing protein n=1 Tax=Trichogramma kaykai TaxID=54128 RepID=A0ABD2VVT4_9HYME
MRRMQKPLLRARHRQPQQQQLVVVRLLLVPLLLLSPLWLDRAPAVEAFPDWTDCPSVCHCKWTSGKKSALCPDAGLTSLPANLDPDMQVIDLTGNRISRLPADTFKSAALVNLQKVFLRNAGLRSVDPRAFDDMRILVEIDLADNYVTSLEPHTFAGNERLKILVLSGNPLKRLKSHQFPLLQHLRTLELQRCRLQEVHPLAFQRLPALETLRLDSNELTSLEPATISGLRRLKTLSLDNNAWSCDCHLRDFCLLLTYGSSSRLYSQSLHCSQPARLQDRRWEDLRAHEFACEPTVLLPTTIIQQEINGNVSLSCLTTGDPEPEVWWQLNGSPVNGTGRRQSIDDITPSGGMVVYSTSLETRRGLIERWSNLTIYNASDIDAGEYTCHARNVAGVARNTVTVSIPRVFSAPTLSQADDWLLWISLAGGGTVALGVSATVVVTVLCVCSTTQLRRRNRKRAKVKLQPSTSFGDQEKKLLDLSVTTTTTTTSSQPTSQQNMLEAASPESPLTHQEDCINHYHQQQLLQHHQAEYDLVTDGSPMAEHMPDCPMGAAESNNVRYEYLGRHRFIDESCWPSVGTLARRCSSSSNAQGAATGASRVILASTGVVASSMVLESPRNNGSDSGKPPSMSSSSQERCPLAVATGSFSPSNVLLVRPCPTHEQRGSETDAGSGAAGDGGRHVEPCYPDLLDIARTYAAIPERYFLVSPDPGAIASSAQAKATMTTTSIQLQSNRPNVAGAELESPYDNMGPRITANGTGCDSAASQLAEDNESTAVAPLIQPPPEFVSL